MRPCGVNLLTTPGSTRDSSLTKSCGAAPMSLSRSAIAASSLRSSPPCYGVVDHQDDDGANDRAHHAVEIEAGDAAGSDGSEYEPPNDRADDAEHDVEEEPFAGFVDDL